ncbi:MAG: hypothetical protein IJQ85_03460 [Selenomonadaceae bacterium]|nr:hypothetical protein [Selenomonadaceae bacterium]
MAEIDINDNEEILKTGCDALIAALGVGGFIKFTRLFYGGKGDYTKEKYERPEMSWDEIMSELEKLRLEREQNKSNPLAEV